MLQTESVQNPEPHSSVRNVFVPNLNFEDELNHPHAAKTRETHRAISELAPLMALLAKPDDTVVVPELPSAGELPACLQQAKFVVETDVSNGPAADTESQLAPWGWTERLRELALRQNMSSKQIPSIDAVRIVNSRRFNAVHDVVVNVDRASERATSTLDRREPRPLASGMDEASEKSSTAFTFDHRVLDVEKERALAEPVAHGSAEGFGKLCQNVDEWRGAIEAFSKQGFNRWVAKPQISNAGRNRLFGNIAPAQSSTPLPQGADDGRRPDEGAVVERAADIANPLTQLNDQQSGWLKKHLQQLGGVYVEPWVEPTDECGIQFDIAPPGQGSSITLMGVTGLINDNMGRYLGSVVSRDDIFERRWSKAVRHGYDVCRAAIAAGYFGPLGIDAFRFRMPDGRLRERFCNDINGRFTMGRLALQLSSQLRSGEFGLWTHQPLRQPLPQQPEMSSVEKGSCDGRKSDVRTIITSPAEIAGRTVRLKTVLLASRDMAALFAATNIAPRNDSVFTHDSDF